VAKIEHQRGGAAQRGGDLVIGLAPETVQADQASVRQRRRPLDRTFGVRPADLAAGRMMDSLQDGPRGQASVEGRERRIDAERRRSPQFIRRRGRRRQERAQRERQPGAPQLGRSRLAQGCCPLAQVSDSS
jgi:hypothetical protein